VDEQEVASNLKRADLVGEGAPDLSDLTLGRRWLCPRRETRKVLQELEEGVSPWRSWDLQ
jgi:hypothetical protein